MKEQNKKNELRFSLQSHILLFHYGRFMEIIHLFRHVMFERHAFVFSKYIAHDKSYFFYKYLLNACNVYIQMMCVVIPLTIISPVCVYAHIEQERGEYALFYFILQLTADHLQSILSIRRKPGTIVSIFKTLYYLIPQEML